MFSISYRYKIFKFAIFSQLLSKRVPLRINKIYGDPLPEKL